MKNAFLLFLCCALIGLSGCATGGYDARYDAGFEKNPAYGYQKFFHAANNYKLISKNDDIYLETVDGSQSRRITHTPNIRETDACITKDMRYIVYIEYVGWSNFWGASNYDSTFKYYLIEFNSDDSTRKEISKDESFGLWARE